MADAAELAYQIALEHGTPYPPQEQALGQTPTILPDIPICSVFLLLFIISGVGHMFLFKHNAHKGRKFIICGMLFGFCFTRIFANCARIAWAVHPTNVKVGIAAMVAVYAGIILLFLANLFFAQRVVRAQHPHFGWSKPFTIAFPILFAIIVGTILTLIIAVIYSFYTLNARTLHRIYTIQLYGETLYAIVAFLPIPIIIISSLARRHPSIRGVKPMDKFGSGSMRIKIVIILVSAILLSLGASWRCAILYLPISYNGGPKPWYFSKPCFYLFDFTIEWVVATAWILVRIDQRFYIPDGAKGPFSYGGGFTFAGEAGNEKTNLGQQQSSSMKHLNRMSGGSRVSWGGSRASLATTRESRISWGGISRDDVAIGIAEDGIETVPYSAFTEDASAAVAADTGIDGTEAEMGWDRKSGRWTLRPISTSASPGALRTTTATAPEGMAIEMGNTAWSSPSLPSLRLGGGEESSAAEKSDAVERKDTVEMAVFAGKEDMGERQEQ